MTTTFRNLAFCAALGFALFSRCASSYAPGVAPQKIMVENEKVTLASLSGLPTFLTVPNWPSSPDSQAALNAALTPIYDDFLAELHRCEKYGLYTVVDSTQGPTVFVSLEIAFKSESADTLYASYNMKISNVVTGNRLRVPGTWKVAVVKEPGASSFHQLGLTLIALCRAFPTEKLVSVFYPQKSSH